MMLTFKEPLCCCSSSSTFWCTFSSCTLSPLQQVLLLTGPIGVFGQQSLFDGAMLGSPRSLRSKLNQSITDKRLSATAVLYWTFKVDRSDLTRIKGSGKVSSNSMGTTSPLSCSMFNTTAAAEELDTGRFTKSAIFGTSLTFSITHCTFWLYRQVEIERDNVILLWMPASKWQLRSG